jgi:hypothetical protein
MQMTGNPNFFSSVQSHVDVAPLSKPMRITCGAFATMKSAIALGSDATIPSRLILPAWSTTHTAVCFKETSNPT